MLEIFFRYLNSEKGPVSWFKSFSQGILNI